MTDDRQTKNAASEGTGASPCSAECPKCFGQGVVVGWAGSLSDNSLEQTAEDCPVCHGEGTVPNGQA